jgi:transposase
MTEERRGRPPVMTEEVQEDILRTIRLGLHADRAALAHGISSGTLRSFKKRNPDFAARMKSAEADAENGFLSRLLMHTDKQWTACAWMLERRWPERWAKKEHVEVSTKGEAEKLLNDLKLIRERNMGTGAA